MKYATVLQPNNTPQTEAIPFSNQVPNSAGGYVWELDDFARLERFLILGAEGGSYYASERKLTLDNANVLMRLIGQQSREAAEKTVGLIASISESGRAPKNDAAIFALALCASKGNGEFRRAAFEALPRVCRTSTHLFSFVDQVKQFRGWGRALRRAVASWYLSKSPDDLAYQMVKYRQREGWSHRDVLRLAHPSAPDSPGYNALFHYATKGCVRMDEAVPRLIHDFEQLQATTMVTQAVPIIERNKSITWEMVPSELLGNSDIWQALLPQMPLTAMIRNLGRMTANGLLAPMSAATRVVCAKLSDADAIQRSKVHPLAILTALRTYQSGSGVRGNLTWKPVSQIVDALDSAFYSAFGNVTSTGKRTLLALDVSGSMSSPAIAGMPGITPRVGSAAMALITARVEPQHCFVGFTAGGVAGRWVDGNTAISTLDISPRQRLDDVIKSISNLPFSGTDCSLPMQWAQANKIPVDTFVIYTDSETYAGRPHPAQALQEYRQATGIGAKLIVVGMVSNGFSIADPNDAGMLDVVGFDSAAPELMAMFSKD